MQETLVDQAGKVVRVVVTDEVLLLRDVDESGTLMGCA
jgi:hypothetical protein